MNLNNAHSDFCIHVRTMRRNNGMTLAKLSCATNIDTANLCKFEKGEGNPELRTLLKVGDGMNCDLRYVPRINTTKQAGIFSSILLIAIGVWLITLGGGRVSLG